MQATERFINAVKNYPCLWNPNVTTYKCRDTRDAAWRDIIGTTKLTDIDSAKEKWKKLKDALRETYNKRRKDSRAKHRKWSRPYKFEHVMQFLIPILEEQVAQKHMEEASMEPEEHEKPMMDPQELNPRGIKRSYSEVYDFNEEFPNMPQDPTRQFPGQPELDALDRFFLSMAESTKKLPDTLQLDVKRKVFNAVLDAEELYVNNVFRAVTETTVEMKTEPESLLELGSDERAADHAYGTSLADTNHDKYN